MDYRDIKHKEIDSLEDELKKSTAQQSDAQAKVNNANNTLTFYTSKYTADETQRTTAYNNAMLAQKSLSTSELAAEIAGGENGGTSEKAALIYDAVQKMTANVHIAAELTADLSYLSQGLADTITKMKKENNLISDLLVKDASTLVTNGTQALSDCIAALNGCVTALDAASVSFENSANVNAMLADLVKKCQWLESQLSTILDAARTTANQSDEEKNEAKRRLEELNRELVKANAKLASDTAALAAANAAIVQ